LGSGGGERPATRSKRVPGASHKHSCPRGGRQNVGTPLNVHYEFRFYAPRGGRPRSDSAPFYGFDVSIHAPRAGATLETECSTSMRCERCFIIEVLGEGLPVAAISHLPRMSIIHGDSRVIACFHSPNVCSDASRNFRRAVRSWSGSRGKACGGLSAEATGRARVASTRGRQRTAVVGGAQAR
jgi:hypothetical protein